MRQLSNAGLAAGGMVNARLATAPASTTPRDITSLLTERVTPFSCPLPAAGPGCPSAIPLVTIVHTTIAIAVDAAVGADQASGS